MAIKSFTRSTIENNIFYRSMLAGNAFYNPSDEDILAEEVLTSSQASVTFSSLDTLAAGYQHLQIRYVIRTNRSGSNNDVIRVELNGDSSASYRWHQLAGNGSSVSSSASGADTAMWASYVSTQDHASGVFGAGVIDLLDCFETSNNTTIRTLGGTTGAITQINLTSGAWFNTAAVTSVKLFQYGSTMDTNSRLTLIGLK
jgi:hypothetical protein